LNISTYDSHISLIQTVEEQRDKRRDYSQPSQTSFLTRVSKRYSNKFFSSAGDL